MKKEPMETTILPEIKRKKRKVSSDYAVTNISYRSLFELYVRVCKIKNLSETRIKGYEYATRYFLDFAGYDLMCYDVTQELALDCNDIRFEYFITNVNSDDWNSDYADYLMAERITDYDSKILEELSVPILTKEEFEQNQIETTQEAISEKAR